MTIKNIDALTLRKWLEDDQAILIDVRQPAEHKNQNIAKAKLIPLDEISKEKLPEIPQEYKYSFLCGYHDGDGHLENGTNASYNYSFEFTCMNEQFLLDIQDQICDRLGKVSARRTVYEYKIYGRDICKDLDRRMTQNVSFYLKRKHF
jgi:hypothetical protein